MSKIFVVRRCGDCPYMRWSGAKTLCGLTDKEIDPLSPDFDKYEAGAGMPDWCPLPDLPEKRYFDKTRIITSDDYATEDITDHFEAFGWNECLETIKGRRWR